MPEQQNIEWKSNWRDEWLEWLCGFANAQGGKLVIGMNDKGAVVGLKNPGKLLEDIPNKIRSVLGIVADVNLCREGDKDYIEIGVPAYPVVITCKGIIYYRSGSTNQRLTGSDQERFLLNKQGRTWDSQPVSSITADDLDDALIDSFKKRAIRKGRLDEAVLEEGKADFIEKLDMTDGGHPTVAAVLLFHKEPQRLFPGAYTKIGYFETDADLRYEDAIKGSLLEQAEQVIEVLRLKYLKNWVYYDGMQRNERYPFPLEALREMLYNCLVHARHDMRIPIQISVYADRVYFANNGGLPPAWTAERLFKKHSSSPRNPDIAHGFYLAGYIESWGRGIEKICAACIEDGIELPVYTVSESDVMAMLKTTEARAQGIDEGVSSTAGGRNGGRSGGIGNTEREALVVDTVLGIIRNDPSATQRYISDVSGLSRRQVERAFVKLKAAGRISRVGSTKSGRWEIIG
jgi:ATP-dependent DNA helicase RecG